MPLGVPGSSGDEGPGGSSAHLASGPCRLPQPPHGVQRSVLVALRSAVSGQARRRTADGRSKWICGGCPSNATEGGIGSRANGGSSVVSTNWQRNGSRPARARWPSRSTIAEPCIWMTASNLSCRCTAPGDHENGGGSIEHRARERSDFGTPVGLAWCPEPAGQVYLDIATHPRSSPPPVGGHAWSTVRATTGCRMIACDKWNVHGSRHRFSSKP